MKSFNVLHVKVRGLRHWSKGLYDLARCGGNSRVEVLLGWEGMIRDTCGLRGTSEKEDRRPVPVSQR